FAREKSFLKISTGAALSALAEIAFILRSGECCSYNFIGHTYRLIGLFLIFRGIFIYNLDHPYAQADKARKQLKLYAEDLEKVIEKRTFEIRRANQKMLEELEYAKRIQETLLPPMEIMIHDVKFVSGYIPCESLSGDFYQIRPIDDDFIGMYIADVSGHGVSAAMMTVFADRAMIPVYEQGEQGKKISPAKTLLQFYRKFNEWNFPNDMYIVIFKAIYHRKERILSYCSGGMNVEPILVRAGGEVEILNQSKGFPICKLGDLYMPEFTNAEVELQKGDRVIFYTDGLAESFKENALMEKTELIRLLQENRNADLHALNQTILKKIIKGSDKIKYDDDITYFIMEA
ncbi:MAG TPA: SpoIIE family protein phosphatase, partial [Clostridiales bacterium]|nr:SpoIIE family protein phosphatase [Clostridiales bacterium]